MFFPDTDRNEAQAWVNLLRDVVWAAANLQEEIMPEHLKGGVTLPRRNHESDEPSRDASLREGFNRVRERHPDIARHWRTIQGIAAILSGDPQDSFFFEAYFESLYLAARFLDESDDSPCEGSIDETSYLLSLPTEHAVQ